MIPEILFWSGTFLGVVMGISSWTRSGDDKRGVVLFPLTLLAASAVAKYIGY